MTSRVPLSNHPKRRCSLADIKARKLTHEDSSLLPVVRVASRIAILFSKLFTLAVRLAALPTLASRASRSRSACPDCCWSAWSSFLSWASESRKDVSWFSRVVRLVAMPLVTLRRVLSCHWNMAAGEAQAEAGVTVGKGSKCKI